jgi:hypothetical protein
MLIMAITRSGKGAVLIIVLESFGITGLWFDAAFSPRAGSSQLPDLGADAGFDRVCVPNNALPVER